MLEIKISENFEPKQGTSNQGAIEVVPSTTKTTKFNVRPEISLENRVLPKTYNHHS